MMYAEEARTIAKEVNARKEAEVKAKTMNYIESTIMPAISVEAAKGNYSVRVTPSANADEFILRDELEELGYEIKIERNFIKIFWG